MGRRVKQADGTYCYTENCRIHDRSSDSTGLKAVLNDAKIHQLNTLTYSTAANLREELGVGGVIAAKMSRKVVEAALHSHRVLPAYDIAEAIKDAAREEGIDPSKVDAIPVAYEIYTDKLKQEEIRKGDEVVLNETGERGTIVEGNSAFGGAIRFNPENIRSRNSFSWFQPSDVTKVEVNSESLMREKIFASPRHSYIPASDIKKLLDEETSASTRNAQGTKEFGRQAKAARANLNAIGDSIGARLGDTRMTKDDVLAVLSREYEMPMDFNVSDAELRATKSGLRNIITYLDPTGDFKRD